VPWPLGVYRGPPEVYRGPCMKITRLKTPIIFTHNVTDSAKNRTFRSPLREVKSSAGARMADRGVANARAENVPRT